MTPPIPMKTKTWIEIRDDLTKGAKAYYIKSGGVYVIVVADTHSQCELPTLEIWQTMPDDVKCFFDTDHIRDFETNFMPTMAKSDRLSDPE